MKKVFFLSDFHLGIDTDLPSKVREKHVVQWLDSIKEEAKEIYLLGDLLDYWFEYKYVVPKGFTRLFGKLAELTDSGVRIEWYTGNHDMWTFGYLEKELGVSIQKTPKIREINDKICFLCHGDGLSKGDVKYKMVKAILANPICQLLFSMIPSRFGLWMMKRSSKGSRLSQKEGSVNEQEKDEQLNKHFESISKKTKVDYFIYGHLHNGKIRTLRNGTSKSINLGDWTKMWSYAEMDEKGNIRLLKYTIPS